MGAVVARAALGDSPFRDSNVGQASILAYVSLVCNSQRPTWPITLPCGDRPSPQLRHFVRLLVAESPQDRPTAGAALGHAFLKRHYGGDDRIAAWFANLRATPRTRRGDAEDWSWFDSEAPADPSGSAFVSHTANEGN
eukprot:Hpha_TRINITY_DN27045_c0_g1::TRINITY_DN27045_c0_g1_i2::g.33169::m.33169